MLRIPAAPKAENKICNIFTKSNIDDEKHNKLNIISNYGLFDAINDNIILPPAYHFVEICKNKKKNRIGLMNRDIIKNIVTKLLNSDELPYKKFIGWCRTISQMNRFYKFFKINFPMLKIYATSCKDNDFNYNNDINEFYKTKNYAILLCVNRHREGSDIKNLDCGLYLDAVKNRSIVVSLQTNGRILRLDENKLKKVGTMVDMFIIQDGITPEFMTVERIMIYYEMILNLATDIDEIRKNHNQLYETYYKFKNLFANTIYNKEINEIVIKLDDDKGIKIKIELIDHQINWSMIKNLLNNEINNKFDLSKELEIKLNIEYLNKIYHFNEQNPIDWKKLYQKLSLNDKKLIPANKIYSKYKLFWKKNNDSWVDALNIRENFYDYDILIKKLFENDISTVNSFIALCDIDNKIPKDIYEAYGLSLEHVLKEVIIQKSHLIEKRIFDFDN